MKKFVVVFVLFALIFSFAFACHASLKTEPVSIPSEDPHENISSGAATEFTEPRAPLTDTVATEATEPAVLVSTENTLPSEFIDEPSIIEPQTVNAEEIIQKINPEITFEDVNETVYATTEVNVRTGPGVKHERIGMLTYGNSVTRTGIGSNGWSKVLYNGQVAYVCSDYLTVSAPAADWGKTEEIETSEAIIVSNEEKTEEDITFTDVNETVYATTGVNVRTGPGVEHPKVGMYYRGNSVTRTGIGSNGWSRIIYNGETAYMHSDYLSTTKPASSGKLGTTGRLTIPSVGVDVALYYCNSSGDYAAKQQAIVDGVDSAAYLDPNDFLATPGGYLIADHKHQGFNAMKNSVPYKTHAYIDFGTHVQEYVCIGIGQGKNLGNDLVDWDGVSLNYDYIRGGLAMYTCNENSRNITISYWQPV